MEIFRKNREFSKKSKKKIEIFRKNRIKKIERFQKNRRKIEEKNAEFFSLKLLKSRIFSPISKRIENASGLPVR